jgi:ParB-like chromosome segregation protein Spo0J
MGVRVENADINEALKQVEARLNDNPADMESKLARLELKVVELARMLDAALEAGNGNSNVPQAVEEKPAQAAPRQGARKIKKLQQNPATGVIEEVEVEDDPADHFIVADGHGRLPASKEGPQHKKPVFIAAADDEAVKK